jgi:AAA15 family ATPase/GTPase
MRYDWKQFDKGRGDKVRILEEVHIQNFRGISNLQLEELGQVNLLVGRNNSGKTTALEAIMGRCHQCSIGFVSSSDDDLMFDTVISSCEFLLNDKEDLLEMLKQFDSKIEDFQLPSANNKEVTPGLTH